MTNTTKEKSKLITLQTRKTSLDLYEEKLDKILGKKTSKLLKDAINHYSEMIYAKSYKKTEPVYDYILFYSEKLCNYVTIKVSDLAKCAVIDEDYIKKYLPKQKVGEPAKTSKQLKKDKEDAILAYTGFLLYKGLKRAPLFAYLERMYWVDFAVNRLGAVPPRTEEEIDERLIKTYKIYAIAYYIQHRPPVAVTRTLLNNLNYDCNVIKECTRGERAGELVSADVETCSGKKLLKKTTVQVDIKCQAVYPANPYGVSKLILGHSICKYDVNGNCLECSGVDPQYDDNVSFVAKRTEREYSYGRGGKCKNTTVGSRLVVFVPTTRPEEFASEDFTVQDLVTTAYQIAISINYVISRVNFR